MSCECVQCQECKGAGHVYYAFDGSYLGSGRCDDLDEMDVCPRCEGSGLSSLCNECEKEERGTRYIHHSSHKGEDHG